MTQSPRTPRAPSSPEVDLQDAVRRWDATAAERVENPIQGWLDSPLVWEMHVLPKIGGGPGHHWLVAAVERHGIPRTGRWLSLGCGAAGTEIAASRWGLFTSLHGLDASSQSLAIARQSAAAERVANVSFAQADLNRLELPREEFDVVLANMSLHHVRSLRGALSAIHGALRPDGWLIVNEFVGPRQFQFTDLQLGLVRDLLAALPERYRQDASTGGLKTDYPRLSIEHWNKADPSEAIRSDLILGEIARQFQVVERVDYGGTILQLLLEHIVHNFDAADREGMAILSLLGRFEDSLIRRGVLPSDFTFLVARKRPAKLRWRSRLPGRARAEHGRLA
jgi:SAM-dependent methyltransferase